MNAPIANGRAGPVNWDRWTVIVLKPDCVERDLVTPVLGRVAASVTVVATERVTVADWQIFVHYSDLMILRHRFAVDGVDVAQCLRDLYIGHEVVVALAYGPDDVTAWRVRQLLGDFDPSQAEPGTIRADFGTDSLPTARAQHRLVNNLIHTSDDPVAARRDFDTWFGRDCKHLLCIPEEKRA